MKSNKQKESQKVLNKEKDLLISVSNNLPSCEEEEESIILEVEPPEPLPWLIVYPS